MSVLTLTYCPWCESSVSPDTMHEVHFDNRDRYMHCETRELRGQHE